MFSNIVLMIGAIAAAGISVIYNAWYQYIQQIEKLRSDWIDAFRSDVSSLASSIHTIIRLWEVKPTTQPHSHDGPKLNELEFERFRCANKELYEKAFKYCASVKMRLHFISAETIYNESSNKSNKELGEQLDGTIDNLIKDFLGNTQKCGENNIELLRSIIAIANGIIENQTKAIESRQKQHTSSKNKSIIFLALIILFIFPFAYFNKEPSIDQVLSEALINTKTENQNNFTKTNTLLENLSKQIKDNIANLEKDSRYLKQLPPKPAIPIKNPKTR